MEIKNSSKYYLKFFIMNTVLILFHFCVFIGFMMSIGAGLSQTDNLVLGIGIISAWLCIQFIIHSLPNVILFKFLDKSKDKSVFIKTETIVFVAMILSYATLFIMS